MIRFVSKTALSLSLLTMLAGCSASPDGNDPHAASTTDPLSAGGTPLFKMLLQDGSRLDHFYTTDWNEVMSAQASGYLDYGPVGSCFTTQQPGTIPLYRLYSSGSVDHFYTTSRDERDAANRNGYAYEGVACYVFPDNEPGTCPLYRYYFYSSSQPGFDDHFYTESAREGAQAVQFGYRYEGLAAFLSPYGDSCPQ